MRLAPHYKLSLVLWIIIALLIPLDPLGFLFGFALILLFGWIAWWRWELERREVERVRNEWKGPLRDLRASQGRPR